MHAAHMFERKGNQLFLMGVRNLIDRYGEQLPKPFMVGLQKLVDERLQD